MIKHGLRLNPHGGGIVIKSHWFNSNDGKNLSVAAVLVEFPSKDIRAYIGYGRDHQGEINKESQEKDEIYIAEWGSEITQITAESIFGPILNWKE